MRIVLQRVKRAGVSVDGALVASVERGFLVLVGFGAGDDPGLPQTRAFTALAEKICDLRVFPDAAGKMNLSLREAGGGVLLVSQFTLYADCRKGRRPSFTGAAPPEVAAALFAAFCDAMETRLPGKTGRGVFGADMDVELVNWGPVTVVLDGADFG